MHRGAEGPASDEPPGRQGPGCRPRTAKGGRTDAEYGGKRRHAARGAERAARRPVPGKEVGSGCDGEVRRRRPLLMGGGSRGGNKTIQKAAKTGRAGRLE